MIIEIIIVNLHLTHLIQKQQMWSAEKLLRAVSLSLGMSRIKEPDCSLNAE
jgi:hypothetical protein